MSSKFAWPLSLPPSLAGAFLLQSFPLPAGKLHIPEPWNETLEFGKGRGRVSLVFTRPPTLSLSPAPSSEKLPGNVLSITSPHGLGAGSGRSPPPPAPAVAGSAGWLALCTADLREPRLGSQLSIARRALESPPRRAAVPAPRLCRPGHEGPGWALRGAAGVPRPSVIRLRGKL